VRSVVETIYDSGKKRRVTIFQHGDGTFGFPEDHFSEDPLERAWVSKRIPGSRCESLEVARREAFSRISWLNEQTTHE
jgi:hypothetical protein